MTWLNGVSPREVKNMRVARTRLRAPSRSAVSRISIPNFREESKCEPFHAPREKRGVSRLGLES